ncbi:MAG: DNA mismatch repair protein MutS domain-containing protein [Bacillota bacterium]|nr:MAG: DNA mismatch repair protein MutS domain-containing protein [Bacillota bacterium]MBS3950811.1 hypothetical protein [Peptococcaceae bacterium]
MLLSPEARQILGFDYCLQQLKPLSPYGQALKTQVVPFAPGQEAELNQELDAVEGLLLLLADSTTEGHILKIRHYLAQMPDWREPLNRVAAGGILSDVELFSLKQNLLFIIAIKFSLKEIKSNPLSGLSLPDFPLLMRLLDPDKTDSPSFYLSDSFSERLAEVRSKIREHQRTWNRLTDNVRSKAAEHVGLKFNPSGEISVPRHDRNIRMRVESSKLFTVSRETYTDIYYELKPTSQEQAVALELERLEKQEAEESEKVRTRLSQAVRRESDKLRRALQSLATLDLAVSKAVLALEWNGSRPVVLASTSPLVLLMEEARHPKVEADLAAQGKTFVPISICLAQGVSLITGANMGGKTVTLRAVGLLAALTAYGMFVPAEHFVVSLVTHIAILAGDYRAELTGLSRFGHEVAGLNNLLTLAPERALLLIDELASSTNPVEGSALAQAVVEHLHEQPSLSLLTTHYDRLADLPGVAHWQVIGLSQVHGNELQEYLSSDSLQELSELMDYRLSRVESPRAIPREALRVARYLGLPDSVLQRATELVQRTQRRRTTV